MIGDMIRNQLGAKGGRIVWTFEQDKLRSTVQVLELVDGKYRGCVADVTTGITWDANGFTIPSSVAGGGRLLAFTVLTASDHKETNAGCNATLDAGTYELVETGATLKLKTKDGAFSLRRADLTPSWSSYLK